MSEENTINEEVETKSEESLNKEEELNKEISSLKTVINDLNDKLLRQMAELDNVRKRSREELEKANKYAISNFANNLVVVLENFYLAFDNVKEEETQKDPAFKHFADAMLMTQKELTKVLEKNGIKRIYPLDQEFDHNFHEAISRIESDEDDGIVKQVIQAGYSIGDRLIRPALVAVSTKSS